MLLIGGVIAVVLAVAGGYLWEGGKLALLWQPAEFFIIAGCAAGILLISTPMSVLSSMMGQVYDSSTGATIGAPFSIAVPDHPWQSWKAFPDGSVAYAGVGSASSTIQIARVLPCAN